MAKTAGTRYAPAIHTHSIIYTHIQLDRHSGFTSANVALDTTQISHLRAWHQKKNHCTPLSLPCFSIPVQKCLEQKLMAQSASAVCQLWQKQHASIPQGCGGRAYALGGAHASESPYTPLNTYTPRLQHCRTASQDDTYKGTDCATERKRVQGSLLRPVFLYRLSHTRGHGR